MIRERDLEYAKDKKDDFYIDDTNETTGPVVRWKSNSRVPFDDMLECFVALGWVTEQERANSNETRDRETSAFLDEYRESMKDYTPGPEELFEMRAAFGPGETVVNIITGKRIEL